MLSCAAWAKKVRKARGLCSGCSTPWSRIARNRSGCWLPNSASRWALVNAYLKRCIKKGLVKVRSAPARRYAYYLTPQGFAEKSRLTVEYLSYSFGFFRQAKTDCSDLFRSAKARGVEKVLLAGQSDLAEIAALCAMEHGIEIIGIVQDGAAKRTFHRASGFCRFRIRIQPFDAVLITDLLRRARPATRPCRASAPNGCLCPICCVSA